MRYRPEEKKRALRYPTREKVIDMGPAQVTAEKQKTIPLQPFIGVLALGGGLVLLLVGWRRT